MISQTSTAGLQITNGELPVTSNMVLLGHYLLLAGQTEKIVTLAVVNPDCTVNLFFN